MGQGDRKLTMDELGRIEAEAYTELSHTPVRLVLDDLRSRHNVGSIFRTADAFGLEGIDLCGFTPLPPHREMEKTALGATASVPWRHMPSALEAVQDLQRKGYTVLAVEQTTQALPLDRWQRGNSSKLALVLGNEVEGVSAAVVEAVDGSVVIPQRGSKHSLNVAVCAGIVVAHVGRSFIHPD